MNLRMAFSYFQVHIQTDHYILKKKIEKDNFKKKRLAIWKTQKNKIRNT